VAFGRIQQKTEETRMKNGKPFRTVSWRAFWVLPFLFFAACSGSGDDPVIREGLFVDAPVAGLTYETPTQSGVTDEDGTFFYEDGQTIQFFLGASPLGDAPAGPRLSPLDLVEDAEGPENPAVTNMARLLLALDADCDPENGIRIDEALTSLFPENALDFSLSPDAFSQDADVQALLARLNASGVFSCAPVALWDALAARAHLRETLGLDAPQYALTVATEGEGSVVRAPDAETYPEGTEVELVATPAEGWAFAGWGGDLTGDEASGTVAMTGDLAVTAAFEPLPPDSFPLTLAVEGQGQVILDPPGGVYEAGTEVTLTVAPAEDWGFVEWSGDLSGAEAVKTVSMDGARSVTARFVLLEQPPPRFSLTTSVEGEGAVLAELAGEDGVYENGASVSLSAEPAVGWTFAGWSGDLEGIESPVSILMEADRSVVARFEEIPETETYSLTVRVNGGGEVTRSPAEGPYAEGAEVSLTASPDPGWVFDGWSGDLTGFRAQETIVMDWEKTVTASFRFPSSPPPSNPDPVQYSLTVTVSGEGDVSPNGGVFASGSEVSLMATPAAGWEFAGWSGDLSGAVSPASLTMSGNRAVTATFAPAQYALTLQTDGEGQASASPAQAEYDSGAEVTLTAEPADGWEFAGWTGGVTGTDNPVTVTMDADQTVTATFQAIQYALTLETVGQGQVTPSPNLAAYDPGAQVELIAEPAEGWTFVGWSGDAGGTDNPTSLTMDADRAATATFEELVRTLSGQVTARGLPVAGAAVRVASQETTTDEGGNYQIPLSLDQRINADGAAPGGPVFPVNVKADGHATGHAKVAYEPGREAYLLNVPLIPATRVLDDGDDVTNRVDIDKDGEKVGELTIPADSLPAEVTEVRGTITYIDPTTRDVDAFPGGDFLAVREGDPNGFELLESYGLMEFDLVDQNGMPIETLPGEAKVCMKIPGTLTVSAGQSIPLWWYDPDAGLWREEGAGTVEERADGSFWVCGTVSHFTWWNYDEPIETHACFKFSFVKEADGTPVTGLEWYAEGVSYGGTSPERPCDCDGDDPAPCPAAAVSSFTVMRDSDIRVYAVINNGTRYYLRDDGDGTFSLSTDEAAATIFRSPDVQGSCMFGENVENCAFLDGPNGDGVLPLGGINYAPDILSFEISDPDGNGQVDADETVTFSVTATDAEGEAITPNWSVDCPDAALANEAQNGDVFTVDFTAPPNLAICTVAFSATDENGNRSEASETIWVFGEPAFGRISGTVYGPDGLPAVQVPVRLSRPADAVNGNWGAVDQVVYTRPDGTYQFDEVPCDQPVFSTAGETLGFAGSVAASADVDGTVWTFEQGVNYSCTEFNNDDCLLDLHFPTRWGTLQGNVIGDPLSEVTFAGGAGADTGQEGGGGALEATVPVAGGAYGPTSAPVGTVFVADPALNSWEWYGFPVFYDGEAVTADIGSGVSGTIQGVVYDDAGIPVANADVTLSLKTGGNQTTVADGSGVFSFTGVGPGLHSLYAQGGGLTFASGAAVIFTQGQTAIADINGTGVTVNATLFEFDGTPMAATPLSLNLGGANEQRNTDAAGQAVFNGMKTGEGYLQLFIQLGDRFASRNFPVGASGSTVDVELQLPAPASECAGFR
jgi:uncharacterized repeat protein (TIGR02543 family)